MGDASEPETQTGERRVLRWIVVGLVLLWLAGSLPLLSGQRTLFERDVFSLHLHQKLFGARELADGHVPYFRSDWGLGQVFRGNPNVLPLYPGNVLYLVLPFWTAFNLHYLAHWLLSLFTMRALARALGLEEGPALFAAVTYATSGFLFGSLTFYNLLTIAAWWPAVMAGILRGTKPAMVGAALACAMCVYGGEPFTMLIGVPPLLLLATQRFGVVRGIARSAAVGAVGLALAAPQIVPVLRTVEFTTRSALGAKGTHLYILHPLRLLELLAPLPFGRSIEYGVDRYLLGRLGEQEPFFLTLHFGVVALPLAVAAARRRLDLAAFCLAGLALAMTGGVLERPLAILSFGLFRFPEKFLFLVALTLPLLAATALQRREESLGTAGRWAWRLAALSLALAPLAWWLGQPVTEWLSTELLPSEVALIGNRRATQTAAALTLTAALLAATALLARRQRTTALLLLQIAVLVRLLGTVETDTTAPFLQAAQWRPLLPERARVAPSTYAPLFGEIEPTYLSEISNKRLFHRVAHEDMDFETGGLYGLEYPLTPDFEGLASPFQLLLFENLPRIPWSSRVNWLRVTGTDAVLLLDGAVPEGLVPIAETLRYGVPTRLLQVERPAPLAWWPLHIVPNTSPMHALQVVSTSDDPVANITVGGEAPPHGAGEVEVVESGNDRLVLAVRSELGGVLAVRRSYHPLWQASANGEALAVRVVNLLLVGVQVPPGEHRVVLEVDKTPDRWAAGLAAVTLAVCCVAVLPRRREHDAEGERSPAPPESSA